MIKKISLLIIAIFLVSCGSSKPTARSTPKKPVTTRTVKKPIPRKPVVTRKPTQQKPIQQKAVAKTQDIKKIEQQYEGAKEESKSTPNETVYSKSEILEATTRVKVTTAMVLDYINQYKDIAKNNMSQYGIPASIILGQGILESGAGTGPLSTLANNHFGIKCHKEWTGPSVSYDDDEAQECFRKYQQPSESYQDHALFLTTRDRYAALFQLDKNDYREWAKGLRAAGYATDPKYPEKLIAIIERYQLNKYDSEVLGTQFVPKTTVPVIAKDSVPSVPVVPPVAVASGADTYQVVQGDTLYSISKKFNLNIDELRRKNNITENSISIGQNLKIK